MIVNVNVEVLPARIGFGVNCFAMLGGRTAVREAVAYPVFVLFTPLSVEVILPLIF